MREHGFKSFGPWIREFHLCAGLFVSPFILVFAISAILLNHTCEPWEAPSDATVETKAGIQLTTGMDDLELALKNRPQEGEGASWADGVELVYRKFSSILETEGVTPIETDGQYFDPTLHEAITNEDNPDFESGQIIEVLKRGYFIGDRVLRPATVRVAR